MPDIFITYHIFRKKATFCPKKATFFNIRRVFGFFRYLKQTCTSSAASSRSPSSPFRRRPLLEGSETKPGTATAAIRTQVDLESDPPPFTGNAFRADLILKPLGVLRSNQRPRVRSFSLASSRFGYFSGCRALSSLRVRLSFAHLRRPFSFSSRRAFWAMAMRALI